MRDAKDRLTVDDLQEIVWDCGVDTYVETGLWEGEQLYIASSVFGLVIGIELDEHYANLAQERVPSATVLLGKSEDVLLEVSANHPEPVCFYLDAHYCRLDPPIAFSEFPLWKELAIIRGRYQSDIVVVDDVHTFGKKRDDIKTPEWAGVTAESIEKFFGKPGEVIKDCYVTWL